MKKNVASQVIGAQMVNASTGAAFTGSVTVYVTGDGGTQAVGSVGSGACTHEGNGYHTYAPAQAETNYDLVAFTFTGTGAIPVTVQVYTTFPQTGDNYARLGAPAGASVSADIAAVKSDSAAILIDTAEIGAAGAGLTEAGGTGDHLTAVPFNAAWEAEIQGDVTASLNSYDPPTNTEMVAAFTEIKGATWSSATDTLEHIRNKQTDIETDTQDLQTQIGIAGAGLTNINLPDQTMNITGNITGNLSGSVGSVTGSVGSVTGNVGGNVVGSVASVTGAVGSVTGNVGGNVAGSIGSLGATAKTEVNAEVLDVLATDTFAEPASVPAATASLKDKIGWLAALARNKITSTATTKSLRNDADSGNIAQATHSDDGTTYTSGEWS